MVVPVGDPRNDVVVRRLSPGDNTAFVQFMDAVPPGDRRFLKENPADTTAAFVAFMERTDRESRLAAVAPDGQIVGLAGAFPGEGWSSHVAEIRVVVSSDYRGHGLGRKLAREALSEAYRLGCANAYVEVVSEQEALVAMFQDLGFDPEALLLDFVRDGDGGFHDLMLLTHRADVQMARHQFVAESEVVA